MTDSSARFSAQPPASPRVLPVLFPCEDDELVGIVHRGQSRQSRGVVIIVAGGPQYRVGAHRQFVLLANLLADLGYPVLRFDLRGMGDSSGKYAGFERSSEDIRSAIDCLTSHESQVKEVVLFGECESASGALFYGYRDSRVKGLVLVNPWVRTAEVQAKVYLRHYYVSRLLSRAFWKKVLHGEYRPLGSLASFVAMLRRAGSGGRMASGGAAGGEAVDSMPLPSRTAFGFRRFAGPRLVITSGKDYIAREFDLVVSESSDWRGLMDQPGVQRVDVPEADHTFSTSAAMLRVRTAVCSWMQSW